MIVDQLHELKKKAEQLLKAITNQDQLNQLRIDLLGKKGELTQVLRGMGQVTEQERPIIGKVANEVRSFIESHIHDCQEKFETERLKSQLESEKVDVTLPGTKPFIGSMHPVAKIIRQAEQIFMGMGYKIAEGPEAETDYYNFEALNLPKNHPARDMQDSFYITEDFLMRTHTSPVQIRTMESLKGEVPLRIICPGKVYRRDEEDATHSFQFHQIEGLVIDKHVRMSDLKGVLLQFVRQMFDQDAKIRLRPSFFPFTEPGAEVDVTCVQCKGKGCRMCKNTGWLEILGCGMVRPKVLEMGGYDPEKYQGFAFGMGVERIAILKYGIEDIRNFYLNDLRFNQQFETL